MTFVYELNYAQVTYQHNDSLCVYVHRETDENGFSISDSSEHEHKQRGTMQLLVCHRCFGFWTLL